MDIIPLMLLTGVAVLLFVAGVPILQSFFIWILGFHFLTPFPLVNLASVPFDTIQSFPFAAIPLFVLTGDLIYEAKVADEILDFSRSLTGWLPGSGGNTALAASGVFSAITGSNAATTASIGKAFYPTLEKEGYEPKFAAATIAAGGTVGGMIPPSILLIIYGVTFGVSIQNLFLAAIVPGFLMLAALFAVNTYVSYTNGYGGTDYEFEPSSIVSTAWKAKIGLGTIVILFVGIFQGLFTPSEAAAVAVLYILLTGFLTRRLTNIRSIVNAFFTSVLLMGMLIPVIVMSTALQQGLSFIGLEGAISEFIIGLEAIWLIMLVMVVLMMISGSLLASVPNLVLTATILQGAAFHIGLTPLQWGIAFMISDMIGFITPPYGLNLYVISSVTEIDYIEVASKSLWYLLSLMIVLLLFFVFPEVNFLSP